MKLKIGDEVYEYDHQALTTREATLLKVQAGLNYSDLQFGNVDDPRVLQAVIWLCRSRPFDKGGGNEKRLMYDDIDVKVTDIEIVRDEAESEPDEPVVPTEATPPESAGSPNGSTVSIKRSPRKAATG